MLHTCWDWLSNADLGFVKVEAARARRALDFGQAKSKLRLRIL